MTTENNCENADSSDSAVGPDPEASATKLPRWGRLRIAEKVIAQASAAVWRWGADRQAVTALVGRYSAHFSILVLALLVGFVGRIAISPEDVVGSAAPRSLLAPAAAEPVVTPTTEGVGGPLYYEPERPRGVVRQAMPLTTIPDRERLEVITYTVQEGDSVYLIAEKFELSPYTIVWSNMEALQGAPWLIQPGLTLAIPPTDGAYHTVMAGETVESIAELYEVSADDLNNIWNDIMVGEPLAEGTLLVIPGGIGEDVEWNPPPPDPTAPGVGVASASWGYCGATAVSGYGANGWFILPTGSYAVSGWVFGDPRNPRHIGLDYRCRLGDPIYAADSGVVVWAGWNGGYGNLVRVSHGNGYETYYAHFSAYAVSCGDPVVQGQIVGYCGSTGWSTGPHLHYEIRKNGVPQNPALFEP